MFKLNQPVETNTFEKINISDLSFDSFTNKKTIILEPKKFLSNLNLSEIWEYRELLYFLALRDIKIRYKQTLIGIAWVLLQPIVTTLIFSVVFLHLGTNQTMSIPYPLYAFSGFTLWFFFSAGITNCSGSLINHTNLITKVYFPRLVIPFSAILATCVDLFFSLISLFVVMLFYRFIPSWHSIFIIFLLIPLIMLSTGIGVLSAALNVKYRDVKYILPFIIQLLFYVSPIFYTLSMLPENSVWLWNLNPLTGILENFRALLFGLPFNWTSFTISTVVATLIFSFSIFIFHKMEDHFADII